jgi:hypothetical protein
MSSRSKKNSRAGYKKALKSNKRFEEDIEREALWDFDTEHDAATVICEVVQEQIINNSAVNLQSYSALAKSANEDLNKSDVVLIISAALVARLGMEVISQDLLSASDTVAATYTSLNLHEKPVLKMFCNLVTILCPEFIKAIESGIFILMSRSSTQTTVPHTSTRIASSMRGLVDSGTTSGYDAGMAAINSRIPISETHLNDAMNQLLLDTPRYTSTPSPIMPMESVSNQNSLSASPSGIDTKQLMRMARSRRSFDSKASELEALTPDSNRSVKVRVKNDKQGVGFADILRMVPEEKAKAKKARIASFVSEKTKIPMVDYSSGAQAAYAQTVISEDEDSLA